MSQVLEALYQLALREGLVGDWQRRKPAAVVRLSESGEVARVELCGASTLAPRAAQRSSNVAPSLLVDNAEYALGVNAKGRGNAERHAAFTRLVERLAAETEDLGAVALLSFLRSPGRRMEAADAVAGLLEEPLLGDELIAFGLESELGLLHERAALRAWWETCRRSEMRDWPRRLCPVTRKVAPVVSVHPKLRGVPGANSAGASLVSANESAFTSHGLEQSEGTHISREGAEGYGDAIAWLLERTEGRRFRQGFSLGEDMVLVFFTETPDEAMAEHLQEGLGASLEQLRKAGTAPRTGVPPRRWTWPPGRFYGLVLKGKAGRVALMDWQESPVAEVAAALTRWYAALSFGAEPHRSLPLWLLLKALNPSGKAPAWHSTTLLSAALRGASLPRTLLPRLLRGLRGREEGLMAHARLALLKATLLLSPLGESALEVPVLLSEEVSHSPYLLGRLFAVLEETQRAAHAPRRLNKGVGERYFSGAMERPASAFPALLALHTHHLKKLARKRPGAAGALGNLATRLLSIAGAMPARHGLEAQALFALAYHQQREALKAERQK